MKKLYLLPGWGFTEQIWTHLLARLGSFCEPVPLNIWDFAGADLEASLDKLQQATEPGSIWLGWSMSGLLVTELNRRHPEHLAAAIFVASTPKFVRDDEWPYAIAPDAMTTFRKQIDCAPAETIHGFSRLVFAGGTATKAQRAEFQSCMLNAEKYLAELKLGLTLLMECDTRVGLVEFAKPRRFIQGEKDQLLASSEVSALQSLLAEPVKILKGASHAPFIDREDEFCSLLEEFVVNLAC